MRIGIDLKNNYKYAAGIAHHFANVLRSLVTVDTRNEYVYLAPNGFRLPELTNPRARYASVPFPVRWGRAGYVLYDQVIFPRYARRERLDVLLCPYYDLPIRGSLPATVAMVHDLVLYERRDLYPRVFGWYYSACLHATLKRAHHVLTLSEYSRQRIIELMGVDPHRVSVLRCTIEPMFERLDNPARVEAVERRFGLRKPYILYSGGVDARKNLDVVFTAFATARQTVGALQLVCVGEAQRYDAFRPRLAALGLTDDAVIFAGLVSQAHLVALYNGCQAVLYPSLYEGFGYPVAEAMACGTPIVCSNVTSLPEVGGDAPFYCNPLDESDVAAKLVTAVSDSGRAAEHVARGLERAPRYYRGANDDQAMRLLTLLESI